MTAAELDEWMLAPGLPKFAVLPHSDAFELVDARARTGSRGKIAAAGPARQGVDHARVGALPRRPAAEAAAAKLAELDAAFALTARGNSEIAFSWLRIAIRNDYAPAYAQLESYLTTIGRRKLIKPLYEDLMKTPAGAAARPRHLRGARGLTTIRSPRPRSTPSCSKATRQ